MKKFLFIFFVCSVLKTVAQPSMYRHYPQTQAWYSVCDIKNLVKTKDGGYILSYLPWSPNLHGPGPVANYVIKTDSNFIPQWKKPYYSSAISLPTGGIILIYGSTIEKVTSSGVQVWIKHGMTGLALKDGVCYTDKIRLVGSVSGLINPPGVLIHYRASQAYTLLMDTSGNHISQSLFNTSVSEWVSIYNWLRPGNADFSKIERDLQGNFFVYSNPNDMLFSASDMCLAKFDNNFNFLWGKTWSPNQRLLLNDIDILPNGRIFATGTINSGGVLLKIDSLGNILQQEYFPNANKISGLCKKPNGNYIISNTGAAQSLFMFETDTAMNIAWHKFFGRGIAISSSIQKNNTLFTPTFYGSDPVILSTDSSGNNCESITQPYSKLTSTISLLNFTLSPVTTTSGINSGTTNVISFQNFVDSCKCSVALQSNPVSQNICINNTASISVVGSDTVSWYSTPSGNSFISSGSGITFSSSTPTVKTFYIRDSLCFYTGGNIPITVTVNAIPELTLTSTSTSICSGMSLTLAAQGAAFYSWNNVSGSSSLVVSPNTNTTYSVTGTGGPSCSDSKTINISVSPTPILTISPTQQYCAGKSSISFSVTGATFYTWSNGLTVNSFTISNPSGNLSYSITGTTGVCTKTASALALANPNPTIMTHASSSSLCAGQTITLGVTGATSYSWGNFSLNNFISVTPSISTTYSVTGFLPTGCSHSATLNLLVIPFPTLSISPTQTICEGSSISFNANGANSYIWSNGISTNSFTLAPPPGNYQFTVTGANSMCSETATTSLIVYHSPNVSLNSSPALLCEGTNATITAVGAVSYVWNNSSNNNFITTSASGDFTVVGSNLHCSQSQTIHIQINPNPTISLSVSNQSICSGENITLLASGAQSYTWSNGSYLNTIYSTPNNNAVYSVTGLNSYDCTDTKTASVVVYPLPIINLSSNSPLICAGENVTITVAGASSYSWSNASTNSFITASPLTSTSYSVIAANQYGCEQIGYFTQSVSSCTGFESLQTSAPQLTIFPNPTEGVFNVILSSLSATATLEVYTSSGQVILSQKITDTSATIDLKNYASGFYYLKISNSDQPIKIIKE